MSERTYGPALSEFGWATCRECQAWRGSMKVLSLKHHRRVRDRQHAQRGVAGTGPRPDAVSDSGKEQQ